MASYTTLLQSPLDLISPEDDNFIEELLDVARLFRPFCEGLDEFLAAHGYTGDPGSTAEKTAFLRAAFEGAGMTPPRDMEKWYNQRQTVRRDTAFQICFAFRLDGTETDEFFRRVFARERSFDCHRVQEAVYYFCLNNGLSYADAQAIIDALPPPPKDLPEGQSAVYTESIIAELNRIDTREALVEYLSGNIAQFSQNNVTASDRIRRLWARAAGPEGLLVREYARFYAPGDDVATGQQAQLPLKDGALRPWDAYLAILQLDKRQVSGLKPDRTIRPIIEKLHADAQDSFPDRQGIEAILAGRRVSYERVRKWLILLVFYTYWAERRLERGTCDAEGPDGVRCIDTIDRYMVDAGYPEMYVGNPYDWLFFYAARDREPLITFREIWQSLLDTITEEG